MDTKIEIPLRLVGSFLGTFFMYRYTAGSAPTWDKHAMIGILVLAILANHAGPLKM